MDTNERKFTDAHRKFVGKNSHCLWTHQRLSNNRQMGATTETKMPPEKTYLLSGTAPLDEAPPKDQQILREAQEKHEKTRCKKLEKLKVTEEIEKNREQTETTPTSFAAASIGTFKSAKVRRDALSARSGISDRPSPWEDQNSWKSLISRRRDYLFSI